MLLLLAPMFGMMFCSASLFMVVIYLWSHRHPDDQTSFFMFQFKGAYLPWVMIAIDFVLNNDVIPSLIGIVVGHIFYFVQDVLPGAESPLKGYHLFATPRFINRLLNLPSTDAAAALNAMREGRDRVQPDRPQRPWGAGRRLAD